MRVKYNEFELELIDEFAEAGYRAERVKLLDSASKDIIIGGQRPDKDLQVMVSIPEYSDLFLEDIRALDALLAQTAIPIHAYLISQEKPSKVEQEKYKLHSFLPLYDLFGEYGVMYGTKIETDPFQGKLAKAIFIIGKDGAIYFENVFSDMAQNIDTTRVVIELNRAAQAYTGAGCHG